MGNENQKSINFIAVQKTSLKSLRSNHQTVPKKYRWVMGNEQIQTYN